MIEATAIHPDSAMAYLAWKVQPTLQVGLIPGNSDPVGHWLTPPKLLGWVEDRFGKVDFDPCPFPRPAGWDGLKEAWGKPGDLCYANPPFVGPSRSRTAWHRQAVAMAEQGRRVVMINSFDRWVVDFVRMGGTFHVPPDFEWLDPAGEPQKSGRPHLVMEYPVCGKKVKE